jgi:hypothetical protein
LIEQTDNEEADRQYRAQSGRFFEQAGANRLLHIA